MSAHHSIEPRRNVEPSSHLDTSHAADRSSASATAPLPENWPVDVTGHSWVMTAIVVFALLVVGGFVYSLCVSERTAQAATQRDR
jgi:hypothetical protein